LGCVEKGKRQAANACLKVLMLPVRAYKFRPLSDL
jgi:hypothetical protein